MPSRLSLYVFLALLAACVLSVSTGTSDLPEKIAIHFNARNEADVWIVRDQYRFLILLCLIGLPLILVWIMAWLPRLTGGKGQIPDHQYWFAPARCYRALFISTCLLARMFYGRDCLWNTYFYTRRECAISGSNGPWRVKVMVAMYLCGLVG